jgi:hypothetical protein
MYFPSIDHYFGNDDNDDDEINEYNNKIKHDNDNNIYYYDSKNIINNNNDDNNDCLICLEIYDITNKNCIKLQNVFYIKTCICDAWIHHYCLDIWFNNNNKCPICLCKMTKKMMDEIKDTNQENCYNMNTLFRDAKYFCLLFCFFYNLTTIIILIYEVSKK